MYATNRAQRKARIATALVVLAVAFAAPTALADENPESDDGAMRVGEECIYVDPWHVPPAWAISVLDCIPG